MGRKTKNLSLVLVPILLAGCGADIPDAQQRDVYTKFEDCMADWGKLELCQQMQQADAQHFAQQTTGVSGGTHAVYWGPSYYPGDRAVIYNGQTYAPVSNRAMSRPFVVTSTSSATAKSSPATARATSVSRGGFGGGGRAAGAGSSGG
jgi:uncharacterized protein YgiB involved in biofilm formation